MKIVRGETNLLEAIGALHSAGRFASRLNGWQQQRHQDPNDGNHHQQLN
jgi:hypothetical protein